MDELREETNESEETTVDNECFSAEERDIHIIHHPNIIPMIELVKGCIIAVRPDVIYYEERPDEPVEPFWLAQIIRQKTVCNS